MKEEDIPFCQGLMNEFTKIIGHNPSSRFWIPAILTNSLIPCKGSLWQRCPGPFTELVD